MTPATPARAACITFVVPNTSYQLFLVPIGEIAAKVGGRLIGVIRARARRVDVVQTGGRYVEPVVGRPRRVQGRIVKIEASAIVVDAGVPIHCALTDERQTPDQFEVGQLVSFDVHDGATFEARG
jgi:hypothetical protein